MKTLDEVLAASHDRPAFANSGHGCGWMAANCDRCRNDRGMRDGGEGCPIIYVTMLSRTPAEFESTGGGGYRCAEFVEDDGVGDTPTVLDLPDHVEVNNGEWLLPADARIVAPGLAIAAAVDGVENGMYRMIRGRYTLTHIPTGCALSATVKHLCARHIEEAAALATGCGVNWDQSGPALKADPAVKSFIGELAGRSRCDHRCDVPAVAP